MNHTVQPTASGDFNVIKKSLNLYNNGTKMQKSILKNCAEKCVNDAELGADAKEFLNLIK